MKKVTNATLFCTLVMASFLFANDTDYPLLGTDSKISIAVGALEGGIAGLGSFIGLYWLTHDFKLPHLKDHRQVAAVWATLGAGFGAIWRYRNAVETQFSFAKKQILKLSQNNVLNVALLNNVDQLIPALKDELFREKLPLYAAFRELDIVFSNLEHYQTSLQNMLESSRVDLYQEANELLVVVDIYQNVIKAALIQLQTDPSFVAEYNTATLEKIQEAQQAAIIAAEMNSFGNFSRHTTIEKE